uniref:Uncharacterized protein n=1 Tax=Rhizophagus irregularis (strain DAOM 181602 / DAOM 197198 / MUCL 43194) TaxID=747089 RepID=U9U480_RHIID
MPIPTCCDNTVDIIEIIITPLSLPLIRLTCALKLFDILCETHGNFMLFILRDANKVFGFLLTYCIVRVSGPKGNKLNTLIA